MRIWSGRMSGLGLVGVLLTVAMIAPEARSQEVAKTFAVSGHTKVRVQTDDGAVRVSTGDIKQVEIRVTYKGYTLDRDLRVSTTQDGDTVEIIAKTMSNWGLHWN